MKSIFISVGVVAFAVALLLGLNITIPLASKVAVAQNNATGTEGNETGTEGNETGTEGNETGTEGNETGTEHNATGTEGNSTSASRDTD